MNACSAFLAGMLALSSIPSSLAGEVACSRRESSWEVLEDSDDEMADLMVGQINDVGAAVVADTVGYKFRRPGGSSNGLRPSVERVGRWRSRAMAVLRGYGFNRLSTRQQRVMGVDFSKLRESLLTSQPFGLRSMASEEVDEVLIFMSGSDSSCNGSDGGYMAGLITINPVPDVDTDWGGMYIFVLGAGACGLASGSSTAHVADIMADLSDRLCDPRE